MFIYTVEVCDYFIKPYSCSKIIVIRKLMNTSLDRIFAFDALRALLLIFLFILHAGLSFMKTEANDQWFYFDTANNIFFDGLIGFITAFIMPIYFVISGLFTEFMFSRHRSHIVLLKRIKRILIPFLLVMLIIMPTVKILVAILNHHENIFIIDTFFSDSGKYIWGINTGHVWFLYYLLAFNIIHFFLVKIGVLKFISGKLKSIFLLLISVFLLLISLFFILLMWKQNTLLGTFSLVPSVYSILGYLLFYFIGVSLPQQKAELTVLLKLSRSFFLLGFFFLLMFFLLSFQKINILLNPMHYDLYIMLSFVCSSVFLSIGGIGLALKYYKTPNNKISFLSKSSYFLYLIHLPFVILFLILCSSLNINAFLKFFIVLFGSMLVSVGVNYIWILLWKNKSPI